MTTLEESISISAGPTRLVRTKAACSTEFAHCLEEQDKWRALWDDAIDKKLVEWGRTLLAITDDDLIPPSKDIVSKACAYAVQMRDAGCPSPLRVCPDGDGGICFENQDGKWFQSLEFAVDGRVTLVTYINCKLDRQQRLE